MPFINMQQSSRELTIFIMYLTFLFDIISAAAPKNFEWIPASTPEADAVNPNGMLILKVIAYFWPMTCEHYSSVAGRLLEVYQEINLTVCFWIFESLIVFYSLMNYSRKPFENLRLD